MRRARRKDNNHPQIERGLAERGISYIDLSALGDDCPDLLVGFRGKNYLFEIKYKGLDEVLDKSSKRVRVRKRVGKLRSGQALLQQTWSGHIRTAYSLEEILSEIGYKEIR